MAVSMPVLHRICSEGKRYDHIVVLNINHDMKNTYCFSAELQRKFGKVVQIGTSYVSSHESDRKAFEVGIYYYAVLNRDKTFSLQRSEVPLRIRSQDLVDSIDMLITLAIANDILPEIRNGKKLFIIEDGGYHSVTLDNLNEFYPELDGNIIGSVEQTTSGTRILSSRTDYRYPSVSIARSEIKMCLESVFIAQRIVEELNAFISYTNHFLNYAQVMLIGYGIFGRAVVKKLDSYGCRISVCDHDARILSAAEQEGYPAFERITPDSFRNDQVIIAMTGSKSFRRRELEQYLASGADNILLSSGSSKDIEYRDLIDLIRDPEGSGWTFTLEETGPWFEKYAVSDGRRQKRFYLIADGMPVNFCRKGSISLTDKVIDLIFAEMALCAVAVIESGSIKNGLYLLGDSSSPVQLDEWKLMNDWFEIHQLYRKSSDPAGFLCIHPCRDYLRSETFHKLSIRTLI